MSTVDFDVVIIGLGPSGGTLANLLAMNNLSILILEKEASIYNLPRAVHFDAVSYTHLTLPTMASV